LVKSKREIIVDEEDVMRAIARITAAVAATMATAIPAFAASTFTDHGDILVCSFLGCCALIIAAIPDERNPRSYEVAKGLSTKDTEAEPL
jgi:pyruvate/2-oxoacid:ferredoxin oxidoreductase alpha subunit